MVAPLLPISPYRKLEEQNPQVLETLRLILGRRHKINRKEGVSYPVQKSGFQKSNWPGRELELIGYARELFKLDPSLQSLIEKPKDQSSLNRMLLRQALKATSLRNQVSAVGTNPFYGKFRSNAIPYIKKAIEKRLGSQFSEFNILPKLSGSSKTDTLFRIAAYTSDDIGLASKDKLIRLARVALFENLIEDAWSKITLARTSSSTSYEVGIAMLVLFEIHKALSLPSLGTSDEEFIVREYASMVYSVAQELLNEGITICGEVAREIREKAAAAAEMQGTENLVTTAA